LKTNEKLQKTLPRCSLDFLGQSWIEIGVKMPLVKPKKNAQLDAVGVGYNSIDHLCVLPMYPDFGSKMKMLDYSIQGGGQTATACAALARLGFSAGYIGKFGNGSSGELAKRSLQDWGVDTSHALHTDKCPNQIAVIWIDGESGERTISYTRGPELDIEPGQIDRDAACAGRILMLDAHNIPAMIEVARWAKQAGIPTVLDAERILDGIDELLDLVDYIITDQFFPKRYTGIDDVKQGLKAMSKHGAFVAATQGEGGSLALVEGQFIRSLALNVKSVDSTGAGDVFHAGFTAGLLLDFDIPKSLAFANVVAGLKCEKLGGRDGIPDRETALEKMGEDRF
jgi:sugar/nucleoside kinase (ribokinase family)